MEKKFICLIILFITTIWLAADSYCESYGTGLKYLYADEKEKAAEIFIKYYQENKDTEYSPWALYHYILLTSDINEVIGLSNVLLNNYSDFKHNDEIIDYAIRIQFLLGNIDETVRLSKILFHQKKYINSKYRVNALYYLGKCYLYQEKYEDARINFSLIRKMYPNHELAEKSTFLLAEGYLYDESTNNIKLALKLFIYLYNNNDNSSEVIYRIGQCYLKLGDRESCNKYWNVILKKYPDSFEADFVRSMMNIKSTNNNTNIKSTGNYFVQVGIYTNSSYADETAAVLVKSGFTDIKTRKISIKGKYYTQIYIGFFATKDEALSHLQKLKEAGYMAMVKSDV